MAAVPDEPPDSGGRKEAVAVYEGGCVYAKTASRTNPNILLKRIDFFRRKRIFRKRGNERGEFPSSADASLGKGMIVFVRIGESLIICP